MKKWNELSPSNFLKLLFAFFTAAFFLAAVVMPDRGEIFSGLWRIVSNPSKVSTNYFAEGGYAATFFNAGTVCLVCTLLFVLTGATANAGSSLAFLLTAGFAFWGIDVLNIWPSFLGVALFCLLRRVPLKEHVNTMLFSTGIAPLVTEMAIRYPGTEVTGFTWHGIVLALFIGGMIGFFLPAGLSHSPKAHKGYDLYSAALPVGLTAFFLRTILYLAPGVEVPAAPSAELLKVASWEITNTFCFVMFGLCILAALAMGCRPRHYWCLLKDSGYSADFTKRHGNASMLMNMGVYGLFIVLYYNLTGATFNGVTFGCIFCMLACCNSGSHPGNVWPIMAGYVGASFLFAWISGVEHGAFSMAINAQAITVGLCFANGLSPVAGRYGWPAGILAGLMHYCLVTGVPALHGGFCLYNGGFTAALTCILLVPILETFCKTREERRELAARKGSAGRS